MDERAFLSEPLELGCQVDQLQLPSVVFYEMVCRRYQLWAEVYSNALREAEGGAGAGGTGWLDEREIFLGQQKGRGSALVAPELKERVAERLQKEAAILKERRLAREEKVLALGGVPAASAAPLAPYMYTALAQAGQQALPGPGQLDAAAQMKAKKEAQGKAKAAARAGAAGQG